MKYKRKHIRHTVRKFTEFVANGLSYSGTIFNLTEEGCYIQVRGSYSIGDIITITHQLDGGPIGEIRQTGTIKRVTKTGIGIEFKRPGYSD